MRLLVWVWILWLALPAMGQGPASQPEAKPLWIAVTAPGLVKTIEPLARRRAGEGFEIRILDDTTLRTARQRANRDVEPIRVKLREVILKPPTGAGKGAASASPPRLVCLVLVGFEPGDPVRGGIGGLPAGGDSPRADAGAPGPVPPKANEFALPGGKGSADDMIGQPSDAVVGDLDSDGRPDVSIGRLPARSEAELTGMIEKIVRFESQTAPAEWQHRFVFLGGSPSYGVVLDRLIEAMVGAGLERLDGRWLGKAFYDNPDSVLSLPPEQLAPAALAAMADGAAVNVYIGHAGTDGFFLRRADLERLKVPVGAGPLIALTCHGGAQETGDDGFAVAAMRNPNGPVATFGAAVVSYPHWNKLLAEGLEKSFFNRAASGGPRGEQDGTVRLAGVIDGMREELAKGELDLVTRAALNLADGSKQDYPAQRRGHLEMYSLFGDPATRLPWRLCEMKLGGPVRAAPGETIKVSGRLADGRLDGAKVKVLLRRPYAAIPPSADPAETPAARHARANRLELAQAEATVAKGSFQAEVQVPPDVKADFIVARAWAIGTGELQAVSSCRIELTEEPIR